MKKAQIGNLQINQGGLYNKIDSGFVGESRVRFETEDGQVVSAIGTHISHILSPGPGYRLPLYSANNTVGTGFDNVAAEFEASGATQGVFPSPTTGGDNLAIKAMVGTSLLGEAKINGKKKQTITLSNGNPVYLDPSRYDFFICNYNNGWSVGVNLSPPGGTKYLIKAGTEIEIFSNNDVTSMYIVNTVRGNNNLRVNGGEIYTLKYTGVDWIVKCFHNNDW